jgi:hypothetical protein
MLRLGLLDGKGKGEADVVYQKGAGWYIRIVGVIDFNTGIDLAKA